MAKRPTNKQPTPKALGPNPNKRNRPDRDRRVRQADRLARVLRVLELVQSRGRWTTKAIADELECSERTVYRDLDVLRFAGIPYFREGDQQFVRVRPDFRFPVITLTDDEVLGLSLAATLTKAPGLDVTAGATPATRKLAAVMKQETQDLIDDAQRLISVLDLKLVDHSRHHDIIRTVQMALMQGKQISGLYESPYEAEPVKLKLHPYRLCLIKNAWYIIGTIAGESIPKTFRVARFKAVRMQAEPATVPDDFDLRTYFGNAWAVFRGDKSYDVELKFQPAAAKVVIETVWHHTQKTKSHKNGCVTLSFRVDGLSEILHWILSWAGQVRVQSPDELKGLFVQTLEDAIQIQAAADHGDE